MSEHTDLIERWCQSLDITNADHIAMWIEANTIPDEPMNQCASWLACRIVEAHEAANADQAAEIARLTALVGEMEVCAVAAILARRREVAGIYNHAFDNGLDAAVAAVRATLARHAKGADRG